MRILTITQTLVVFDLETDNCDGMTVADLKQKLQNFPGVELRGGEQCLRYDGVFLSDEMLLNDVLGEKRELFYLTRINDVNNNIEPNEEDGAVGGERVLKEAGDIDKCSILTESDFKNMTMVPGFDLSTDDEGSAGVFDEDMELPPDLQQYYTNYVSVNMDLVKKLVAMGYEELDAHDALQASFNDPDRAVEYLIDGIPKSLILNLPTTCDMANTRTPPPSYAGSICSDFSMAPTPPTPHSPDVSINSSNIISCKCQIGESGTEAMKRAINEIDLSSENERQGYDGNDEADKQSIQLSIRKRKMSSKYKKRCIEVWAKKAMIETVAQNQTTNDEDSKYQQQLIEQMTYVSINDFPLTVPSLTTETIELTAETGYTKDSNTAAGDHKENMNSKV